MDGICDWSVNPFRNMPAWHTSTGDSERLNPEHGNEWVHHDIPHFFVLYPYFVVVVTAGVYVPVLGPSRDDQSTRILSSGSGFRI